MPDELSQRPLARKRAESAYNDVKNIILEKTPNFKSNYKSLVKKAPMWIKTQGLKEAMAFVFSKKDSGNVHYHFYEQMYNWLNSQGFITCDNAKDFMENILELEPAFYRAATEESLAYLTWVRRFAEGLVGEENE